MSNVMKNQMKNRRVASKKAKVKSKNPLINFAPLHLCAFALKIKVNESI